MDYGGVERCFATQAGFMPLPRYPRDSYDELSLKTKNNYLNTIFLLFSKVNEGLFLFLLENIQLA